MFTIFFMTSTSAVAVNILRFPHIKDILRKFFCNNAKENQNTLPLGFELDTAYSS